MGTVYADRQGLLESLRNLLENAVRHSDEGGIIQVTARRVEGDIVHIEVSDEGEGMTRKALPRIFERFYRADSSRARDIGGTGLGLAIVRHLIEGMGGRVEADSELGEGATIRIILPFSQSCDVSEQKNPDGTVMPSFDQSIQDSATGLANSVTLFPGAEKDSVT